MEFKFKFEDKEYILTEENLEYFANDEETPIKNICEEDIINMMNNNSSEVDFAKAYFNLACENCQDGVADKKKFFAFLEYLFFIYTKNEEVVISRIDKEYEGLSYNRLERAGKVDNSYIVSINVCKNCGSYSIEIEQLEV